MLPIVPNEIKEKRNKRDLFLGETQEIKADKAVVFLIQKEYSSMKELERRRKWLGRGAIIFLYN